MKITIPFVERENTEKEGHTRWGPGEDAVLSSEGLRRGACRTAVGGCPQAARGQSQQAEAQRYEWAAQTGQLRYQGSHQTVITLSLNSGLCRN